MTTRREFIKQTSIAAAGVMLANKAFAVNFIKKPEVAILGAGLAGLAAAKMLIENGYDVTIFEARDRVGGRVFSHTIDEKENLVIEFGAEWIGDMHERMLELCSEFNLELIDNRFKDRMIYYNKYYAPGPGRYTPDWLFSPEWKLKYEKIKADYKNFTDQDKKILDKINWWRFLMNNDIPEKDLDIMEYSNSTDFGESIRFVSAYAALAEYAESGEYNEMDKKIKGGNSLLPEAIAAKIGSDKIRLNHKVVSVEQSSRIKIICDNGQSFEFDKLICTLPTFSMSKINWNPALTKDKIEAINALQYGRIIKNALVFKEEFWKDESFSIVTDTFSHFFYHATKFQPSTKGVLISYAIGDKADIFSHLTKEEREKTIAESLKAGFGDVSGLIEKSSYYYWGRDKYSMGAYALYGSGQWFTLMPVLKEKMNEIYFAGEHVAEWQGFMEGAIVTGEEAAKEILG